MRTAELIGASTLVVLALVVGAEGLRLGVGWGTDGPESGFFVFYLGLVLAIAAVTILVQALVGLDRPLYRKQFLAAGQVAPVLTVLLPAAAMILLTQVVGLYVAGAVYVGTYMRSIGRHSWALTAVVAVGIPLATFLVFEVWFLVPLPKGPLEAYLGY